MDQKRLAYMIFAALAVIHIVYAIIILFNNLTTDKAYEYGYVTSSNRSANGSNDYDTAVRYIYNRVEYNGVVMTTSQYQQNDKIRLSFLQANPSRELMHAPSGWHSAYNSFLVGVLWALTAYITQKSC